ncbi:MAG: hypothetical protein JW726_06340, partial [Anaerolineales bacterium]|nr:hypothetical protein [Anaerolineales bacterium]
MLKLIRWPTLIFALILLAYSVYAAVYIYQSSFVVNGERYFVLFDDAMISMRYARNLANGNGLVWNPGERVEGYTNLLWVLYMAIFHLLPIPISKISLAIQISGGIFFMSSLYFLKKIVEELTSSTLAALVAIFITAFYSMFTTWSLLGMEVSLCLLITNVAVWRGLRMMKGGAFSPWLYVILGASTLLRMDMVVIFLAIFAFLFMADAHNRRRHMAWGAGMLVLFLGGQTLFRLAYYGELLPNTYYLKVTGAPLLLMLQRGVYVFFKFAWNFNIALFLIPFAFVLIRREKQTLFLAWVFTAMCAYSIYVGGDAWESKGGANRFISTTLPLFFALFTLALDTVRSLLVDTYSAPVQEDTSPKQPAHKGPRFPFSPRLLTILSHLILIAFAIVSLVNFNALLDTSSLKFWLLLKEQPLFVSGSERYVRISEVVRDITTPEATVAVVTAGIIPYYSERPAIDFMG